MAYRFEPGDAVERQVRKVALDQVCRAISDLTHASDQADEAIHDCRKRCKKLRGLVRLVRPALGDQYSTANETFRDASRQLSAFRDSHALLATFDELCRARAEHVPDGGIGEVRTELRRRSDAASRRARDDHERVAEALRLLRVGQELTDGLTLDATGFDAVAGGLEKTYARGRRALGAAIESPTTQRLHEYRKRVKYTWYHTRLLREVAPAQIDPMSSGLHALSDTLGDEHDLAVLSEQLSADPDAFGGEEPVARARFLLDGQRADLRRRALSGGVRLHAERPGAFVRRMRSYWEAWHSCGPQLELGAIADLR